MGKQEQKLELKKFIKNCIICLQTQNECKYAKKFNRKVCGYHKISQAIRIRNEK